MFDIPIDNVQIVQEYVTNESQSTDDTLYEMSEVDLSFCDALASMCSGESSSGPTTRQGSKQIKKTTV